MARLSARQLQRNAFLAKWSKVDWSKQNCELAGEIGLSGERIRQIRQRLGAPNASHHNRKRNTRQALQWAKGNLDELKGLSPAELGRKYGLSTGWRSGPLYLFLKPFLRNSKRMPPWDRMNFRLPNRDVARIWRLPPNLVSKHRLKKLHLSPTWRCKTGTGGIQFSGRAQVQAYHRAVKAEKRQAARYFAHASGCGAGGKRAFQGRSGGSKESEKKPDGV
jgi:hypothetical protein